MAKTLVTGATGFIGSHVARALAERGDELRLLVRRSSRVDHLADLDFARTTGDVTDRRSVRRAMKDADRVFHVAGKTSLRAGDETAVYDVNVRGTRTVVEEALRAGVERVVYTSSVAAVGPANPRGAVDEAHRFPADLTLTYPNSKHQGEVEVLRAAGQGLPAVIVNPSFVLGPDDPQGSSMGLVRRFLLRRIPVYTGGALNIVDVRDVAQGHLLADEKGEPGERYILAGRNFTLQRLFADFARISGVPPPAIQVPGAVLTGWLEVANRVRIPVPVSAEEARSATMWWTCRNTKARRELGFAPRPHEETLEEAVHWQSDQLGDRVRRGSGPADVALGAVGRAMRFGARMVGV